MIGQQPFNRAEKKFMGLGLAVLVFSYFYNLGIYPLFQEEPRRGIIALEMILQDNYWVPTQTGDLYFRKPPVYNWLLIIAYKLFGEYSELATRFFSVVSHLVMSGLCYFFIRNQVGHFVATITAFGFLLVGDILLSASTLGEIDLFYTLVTASSVFLIYHFGEKRDYLKLFTAVYTLTAVGFLTKGLSSLPFTAISLLVYFIMSREFRQLLRWPHFAGIGLFATLSGLYFYMYSQFEDPQGWVITLFSESADKATQGGMAKFLMHLVEFPFQTFMNVLPAGLFVALLFRKGAFEVLKANKFIWFCTLVFFFNFLIYMLSVEGKSRYIYPIVPFLLALLVYIASKYSGEFWTKFIRVVALCGLVLLSAALPATWFIPSLQVVDHLTLNVVIIMLAVMVLWYLFIKERVRPILIIFGMMIMLKFGMSAIVPVTRAKATGAAEDKALAMEMVEIVGDEPIYRYKGLRMSLTIVFYLEREKQDIIRSKDTVESGYYVCYKDDLKDFEGAQVLKEFTYFGSIPMYFIKY